MVEEKNLPTKESVSQSVDKQAGGLTVNGKEFFVGPLNMGDRKKIKEKCGVDILAFRGEGDELGEKVACILEYGFEKAGMSQEEIDLVPLGKLIPIQEELFRGMEPRPT